MQQRQLNSKEAAILASEVLNGQQGELFMSVLKILAGMPATSGVDYLQQGADTVHAYLTWREGRIDLVKELRRMAEYGRRIKLARADGNPDPEQAITGFDGDIGDTEGWNF